MNLPALKKLLKVYTHTSEGMTTSEAKEVYQTELLQAKFRIKIATILLIASICFFVYYWINGIDYQSVLLIISFILIGGTGMLIQQYLTKNSKDKLPSGKRILFGQLSDTGFVTVGLILLSGNDPVVAYYTPIYTLTILGNGLRFGRPFLFSSAAMSIIGFGSAFMMNEALQTNYQFFMVHYHQLFSFGNLHFSSYFETKSSSK